MSVYTTGDSNGIAGNTEGVTTFGLDELSSNPSIANLTSGILVKWGEGIGSGASLTYSMVSEESYYLEDYKDGALPMATLLTAEQEVTAVLAMSSWAAVSGLTFIEVTDSSTLAGDIRWGATSDPNEDTAYAEFPASTAQAGDIWFGTAGGQYLTPNAGDYAYFTFMHELGHALGLNHPHHSDESYKPVPGEDQIKYSVMSYASYAGAGHDGYLNDVFPTTPMLNDILAIQWLYGVNTTTATGDDVYAWAADSAVFETIWDAGGEDTLSAEGQAEACLINLNSGEWSEIGVAFSNGLEMVRDCLTIAYGVVIENAVGSDHDDGLIGNSAGNLLVGGLGADTMVGGNGNDTYRVDDVRDRVVEGTAGGSDRVEAWVDWKLGANIESLFLEGESHLWGIGNALDNELVGNSGNNLIKGYGGLDQLAGGMGNETYFVDSADDRVIESAEAGVDVVYAKSDYTLSVNVERLYLMEGFAAVSGAGGAGDNVVVGNSLGNELSGGEGDDRLYGRLGSDTYHFGRGGGHDTVSDQDARLVENHDVLQFASGIGHDQLWFSRRGYNLEVSVIGTSDRVTVRGWFSGSDNRVEEIRTVDGGLMLSASGADSLVAAMASLTPPPLGQTTLTAEQHAALDGVIAATWS